MTIWIALGYLLGSVGTLLYNWKDLQMELRRYEHESWIPYTAIVLILMFWPIAVATDLVNYIRLLLSGKKACTCDDKECN